MTDAELLHALLHFQSKEASVRFHPDPRHLREVAEELRTAFTDKHLDPDFIRRVKEALVDALYRQDAVPRTDLFWHQTNGQPTLGRLPYLAEAVLQESPEEEWPLWALAAWDVLNCSDDFGLPAWQEMHARGSLDVAWPVNAAYHVWSAAQKDRTDALVRFLHETHSSGVAGAALEPMLYSGDPRVEGWAEEILRRCPAAIEADWLTRNSGTVRRLAAHIQEDGTFERLPILADALEEAGCSDARMLGHLRGHAPHRRGCFVLDAILAKEGM